MSESELLAIVFEKVDRVLTRNNLLFKGSKCEEEATEKLRKWVYRYYDDNGASSDSYVPGNSDENEVVVSEEEEEESVSMSLSE